MSCAAGARVHQRRLPAEICIGDAMTVCTDDQDARLHVTWQARRAAVCPPFGPPDAFVEIAEDANDTGAAGAVCTVYPPFVRPILQ